VEISNREPRPQTTLKNSAEFRGVGLHTGEETVLRVLPAGPDHGIVFCRVDLEGKPRVEARTSKLTKKERRTGLRDGSAEVCTVEHFLASCYGLRLDNALVEISGEEIPGMDGSALPFAEGLLEAGMVEQKVSRKELRLREPLVVGEGLVSLVALPSENGFSIQYHFAHPKGGVETFETEITPETFVKEIAPARTFVVEEEILALQEAGLGKGADESNTVLVGPKGPKPSQLRFENEPVRHKILDLLGDLALGGFDLDARLIANRSGHNLNHSLVKELEEQCRALEEGGFLTRESGMNIRDIMQLLPHRYPFLLVDRVLEIEGYHRAVGIKNVTVNEPFFMGHWPEQPIMPGVLQLEAMAQMAGILLFRKLENTGKLAVLWSIDRVKFRGAVVPGDQLRIEVETIRLRPGMGHVMARCKVAGKLVAEAQLKFTLVDA